MSWTPGPWKVTASGRLVGSEDEMEIIASLYWGNFEADGRLIRAAPEMAELLERWHETGIDVRALTGDDGTVPPSLAEDTQALLARARGED